MNPSNPHHVATTYEPHRRRVSCTCGWWRTVTDDVEADQLLDEHTAAHVLLRDAGVAR